MINNGNAAAETTNFIIETEEIKDKYHLTYLLFYALGILTIVPAYFFPAATDYWMYKFRDLNSDNYNNHVNRTELQAAFTSYYSIVANVTNIIFLILTNLFINKIPITRRILGTLCGAISMFALTILFIVIDTDSWQTAFFAVTLVIAFFLTGCCATFMVTLFELAARFPPQYATAILTGQSICGILSALVQIISLSFGAKSSIVGLIYFVIGMCFVLSILISFILILTKSEFFRYNLYKVIENEQNAMNKTVVFSILGKIKYYMIAMGVSLGCSIMLHPGVTSLVVSIEKGNGNKWNDVYYVPVATFLFWNLFEYFGREISGKLRLPKNGIIILGMSVVRIGLVPMVIFCNIQPRNKLSVTFDKDYLYIVLVILLSLSNGFLVNLSVIRSHMAIQKREYKKITMTIIISCLYLSLSSCSFLSAIIIKSL